MSILDAHHSKPLLGGPSFTLWHRVYRLVWSLAWVVLASWTPAPLHRWRNILLRCFGARLHSTARVYSSAKVWFPPNLTMHEHAVLGPRTNCYCMDKITIGRMAIISQGAHLCTGTHDITDSNFQLITKPIFIDQAAWIAAEAFIGPGVSVGRFAVIGARAVVFRDAEAFGVYAGNPAILIKTRVIADLSPSIDTELT